MSKEKKFLRELFHEINNSANAIKGLGELLERGKEEKERELIEGIKGEAKSIIENIERYTTFASPLSPQLTPLRIDEVLKKVTLLSKRDLEKNKITLYYKTEKNPLIKGDRELLKEVFYNLVLNAVQAMPQGGRLTISSESIILPFYLPASSNYFLEIAFSDTGIGIEKKNLSKIFQPFFTTKSGRIGLGLSMVKKIIEAHKGRISVENKEKGTTFKVLFPLRRKE